MNQNSFTHIKDPDVSFWVRKDLVNQSKRLSLCYNCAKCNPGSREENCPIMNSLENFNKEHGLAVPVIECPSFVFGGMSTTKDSR